MSHPENSHMTDQFSDHEHKSPINPPHIHISRSPSPRPAEQNQFAQALTHLSAQIERLQLQQQNTQSQIQQQVSEAVQHILTHQPATTSAARSVNLPSAQTHEQKAKV